MNEWILRGKIRGGKAEKRVKRRHINERRFIEGLIHQEIHQEKLNVRPINM
jgi:hypothetical protein